MSTSDAIDSSAKKIAQTILCVNGRFLSRPQTGVDRFAYEVLAALDDLMEGENSSLVGFRVQIIAPSEVALERRFKKIPAVLHGLSSGQRWEQFDLPKAVGENVLLSLCNTGPIVVRKQLVVIHDAATVVIPQSFSRSFRWWYRILMPLLGRRSRLVLTVSEFSKGELVRRFGIPANKIRVVSEGGEHILREPADATAVSRFGLAQRPFVLAVSSMAAHKNFKLVLEALALLPDAPFDVAIAGGANARVFGDAGKLSSDRVKWLGYVSDAELRALYENAMCFVFPSLYEGFGIPPLEAMTCGCPVLVSRAASMPEVCGEQALYFDPSSPVELAGLLMRVAGDAGLRADLSRRGRERAAMFSWQKAARQVLAACREVME